MSVCGQECDADSVYDRSPALGGEVLAIDRHFFQSVGAYDPGMQLWGEEQIELSIRVNVFHYELSILSLETIQLLIQDRVIAESCWSNFMSRRVMTHLPQC